MRTSTEARNRGRPERGSCGETRVSTGVCDAEMSAAAYGSSQQGNRVDIRLRSRDCSLVIHCSTRPISDAYA